MIKSFTEQQMARGDLIITKTDSITGTVTEQLAINLVVNTGKAYIASRMVGTASGVMTHMAIGSSNIVPVATDAALFSEIGRVALSSSSVSGTVITYNAYYGAGVATGTLSEAGIFNASSAGTMLCRTTFPSIVKSVTDTISVSWAVSII